MEQNRSNFQLIGILASQGYIEEKSPDRKLDNVFINSENELQYLVRAMTSRSLPVDFFTGYINSIDNNNDLDPTYENGLERIKYFKKALEKYLIVFNYRSTYTVKGTMYKIDNASLVSRPTGVRDEDTFLPVPVFSASNFTDWEIKHGKRLFRRYSSFDEFIATINRHESVGNIEWLDKESSFPRFVMWIDENKWYAIGPFGEPESTALGGVVLNPSGSLAYIDVEELREACIVYDEGVNPTLMHLTTDIFSKVFDIFAKQEAIPISDSIMKSGKLEKLSNSETKDIEGLEKELVTFPTDIKNDDLVIQQMKYISQKMNLYYADEDLVNFHTAVKCGNLVILSGMSGTGKSAIADVYARALGASMLLIPVRPSWNDDADLLGYVDLVHMIYRASDTGFVRMLVDAEKEANKNKVYFVCFDEMNLARVEHYFSQFLSILEKPVGQRKLRLYDEQYSGRLYNSADYPDTITIGDNVKFIGTVNIDESTYHFSDKVLDRANVMTLSVLDYSNKWVEVNYGSITTPIWSVDDYKGILKKDTCNSEVRGFLWALHNVLQTTSARFGVGPRVVKSIEGYLANLPIDGHTVTALQGLDNQVAQRILTKIRGPEDQVGGLFAEKGTDGITTILSVLNQYSHLSKFEKSHKIIQEKQKELKIYGYCT